jgi:hypothetical protein
MDECVDSAAASFTQILKIHQDAYTMASRKKSNIDPLWSIMPSLSVSTEGFPKDHRPFEAHRICFEELASANSSERVKADVDRHMLSRDSIQRVLETFANGKMAARIELRKRIEDVRKILETTKQTLDKLEKGADVVLRADLTDPQH